MKINKFLAFTMIAVIAVGVMGFFSTRALAQTTTPPAPQNQVTETDTDQVQEQAGDTTGTDTAAETGEAAGSETGEAAGKESQETVPLGTPAISAESALKAAQDYLQSTATGTATLDDENGTLVYSVDINGSDVKVDANTGAVLTSEPVEAGQAGSGN